MVIFFIETTSNWAEKPTNMGLAVNKTWQSQKPQRGMQATKMLTS